VKIVPMAYATENRLRLLSPHPTSGLKKGDMAMSTAESSSARTALKNEPSTQERRPSARASKPEPLLLVTDAAEVLRVSPKQVRRYIADPDPRKRLRSIKIGGAVRIARVDLEDFIRDHRK
jgi:excisionase family DNA binding protein